MSNEAPRKTGKWLRDDIPHTGWRCDEINNAGGICQMCEVTQIVYAHVMRHDRYPLWLECGCVCAGYMTDDPATEQLRELLYKWRRLQLLNRTPVEKLRRQKWHSTRWRRGGWSGNDVHHGHVLGWYFREGKWHDHYRDFRVELGNADGWRFYVYYCRNLIKTSKPFPNDLDAALAGIAWAEMLMVNQQWLASDSEAIVEERAARAAEELVRMIRYTAERARELGRPDIAAAVEARTLSTAEAWVTLRAAKQHMAEAAP
jgi:hypothetical protein